MQIPQLQLFIKMVQSTISLSRISLSPSLLSLWALLCATLACATLLDQIEHCELDCRSTTVEGLNLVGNCEPKCSQGVKIPSHVEKEGQDAIKNYLDSLFSNALLGSDSSETGQTQERHPESFSIEPNSKIPIKHEGESNKDADKSAYKLPKKSGEGQLLDDDIAVNVGLEIVGDGEYVLKIKRISPSSTHEDEVERAKHMAQNGATLLLYGEMLQHMGEKLLAQSQESLYSIFNMPVPPKSKSDQ